MRLAGAAFLLLASSLAAGTAFPPAVEALRPQLDEAERRLQGATLAHEAARREAEPASEAVAQARAQADHWWGRWLLRRDLGRLRERLDKVEAARVEREAARQELFLLLTGAEEELRGALEKALRGAAGKADLGDWWRQERSWSLRLESLELAYEDEARDDASHPYRLLAQARLEQLGRDRRILDGLRARRVVTAEAYAVDKARLEAAIGRIRRSLRSPGP